MIALSIFSIFTAEFPAHALLFVMACAVLYGAGLGAWAALRGDYAPNAPLKAIIFLFLGGALSRLGFDLDAILISHNSAYAGTHVAPTVIWLAFSLVTGLALHASHTLCARALRWRRQRPRARRQRRHAP